MNKTQIALIIACLIIMCLIGYIFFKEVYQRAYQQGFNDGQLLIIQNIQQTRQIPVLVNQNNQTSINWIPIQNLCP